MLVLASRTIVVPAANALDCWLVDVTEITWLVPSWPKVQSWPLSSRDSFDISDL